MPDSIKTAALRRALRDARFNLEEVLAARDDEAKIIAKAAMRAVEEGWWERVQNAKLAVTSANRKLEKQLEAEGRL